MSMLQKTRMARTGLAFMLAASLIAPGCSRFTWKEAGFKSYVYAPEQAFPPKVKKAEITKIAETELLKKGYVPLGIVTVKHLAGEQYKIDTTTEAQMTAAAHGAELLELHVDQEPREDLQMKRGKCLESRKQMVYASQPEKSYDQWKEITECLRWERIPVRTNIILSRGVGWRHEPDFLGRNASLIFLELVQDGEMSLAKVVLNTLPVDANSTDRFGMTALMNTAFYSTPDSIDMARLLIAKGADVNARDHQGVTALMRAVVNNNMEIAELLIRNGADLTAEDNEGKNVLDYAIEDNRETVVKWVKAGQNKKK